MRSSKSLLLLVASLAVCSASSRGLQSQDGNRRVQPAFSVTVVPSRDTVRAGEDVRVRIVLTNTSDHRIQVYADKSRNAVLAGYTVEVQNSERKAARMTRFYWTLTGKKAPKESVVEGADREFVMVESGGQITVDPGKSTEDAVEVRQLYDVREPGTYSIQVYRKDPSTGAVVRSNKCSVTVVASDR